jgi:hypothetical protein
LSFKNIPALPSACDDFGSAAIVIFSQGVCVYSLSGTLSIRITPVERPSNCKRLEV